MYKDERMLAKDFSDKIGRVPNLIVSCQILAAPVLAAQERQERAIAANVARRQLPRSSQRLLILRWAGVQLVRLGTRIADPRPAMDSPPHGA